MTDKLTGKWFNLPDWQEGPLQNLAEPGLFRFVLNGRVVYIGYAARAKPGLAGRIAAYRRGDVKTHRASQAIARLKDQLELWVMFSDAPPAEIKRAAKEIVRRYNPRFNRINSFLGRI
ncbi:MAG: hypothetical protein ACJLS3_03315 [Erythrobacter sp.]